MEIKKQKLGTVVLEFDKDFLFFDPYWKSLSQMASIAENDFLDEIGKEETIEAILMEAPHIAAEKVDEAVSLCVDILVENEIYDIDMDVFKDECRDTILLESTDEYCELKEKYDAICNSEELRKQQVEYLRAHRSYWQGGGFGLRGAISGAIKAGALNLATEIFRGVKDTVADSISSSKFNKIRAKLVTDENIRSLGDGVRYCIITGAMDTLANILEERLGVSGRSVRWDDSNRAAAIFNNIDRVKDVKKKLELIARSIMLCPYDWDFIRWVYQNQKALDVPLKEIDDLADLIDGFTFALDKQEEFGDEIQDIIESEGYGSSSVSKIFNEAVLYGYLDASGKEIEQKYEFSKRFPLTIQLLMASLEMVGNAAHLISDKLSSYKTYEEAQKEENEFRDLLLKYHLIDHFDDDRLTVRLGDLKDEDPGAAMGEYLKLLHQITQEKLKERLCVEGYCFETLEEANAYRSDLAKIRSFAPLIWKQDIYGETTLKNIKESINTGVLILSGPKTIFKRLEGTIQREHEHTNSEEYKNGVKFLEGISFIKETWVLKRGDAEFEKAVEKLVESVRLSSVEHPLCLYTEKGFQKFLLVTETGLWHYPYRYAVDKPPLPLFLRYENIDLSKVKPEGIEFYVKVSGDDYLMELPADFPKEIFLSAMASAFGFISVDLIQEQKAKIESLNIFTSTMKVIAKEKSAKEETGGEIKRGLASVVKDACNGLSGAELKKLSDEELYKRLKQFKEANIVLAKKETGYLKELIEPYERLIYATQVNVNGSNALTAITDRRLLFIISELSEGIKVTDIPLSNIEHISVKKGIIYSKMEIRHRSGIINISWSINSAANYLAEQIEEVISQKK